MQFLWTLALGALVSVATTQAAGATGGVSPDAILVGQSASLTGNADELGQQERDGALACFSRVNESGGVNGRQIKLVSLDDAGQAGRGAENTKRLIEEDKVFVLFGYTGRNTSEAALPLVNSAGVPFVGAATGANTLHESFNRYVFNVRAGYATELEAIADYLVTASYRRIGFLHLTDDTQKLNLHTFEAALARHRVSLATEAQIDRNLKSDAELRPVLTKLLKASPDAVAMVGPARSLGTFIKEARSAGLNPQWVSMSFAGEPLFAELGKAAAGIIMSQVVPLPTNRALPIVREYQAAMAKYMPSTKLTFNSLEGYLAAKVLVVGLREAGRDLTRNGLISALERQNDLDLGGFAISYSPKNHNGSKFVDMVIFRGDGRFMD